LEFSENKHHPPHYSNANSISYTPYYIKNNEFYETTFKIHNLYVIYI